MNGPNDIWIDNKGGIIYDRSLLPTPILDTRQTRFLTVRKFIIAAKEGKQQLIVVDAQNYKNNPNGIVGTPDGKYLYVADIGDNKTYKYTINKDGTLSNRRRLFVAQGSDSGMTFYG